jgi:hypothetical protein
LSHVIKIDEPPVMALVLLSLALMALRHLKARRGS